MGVVSRLRALVGRDTEETAPAPDPEPQAPDETEADPVSLFECPACETVYIAVEKARCSQCDVAFDETQTGRSPVTGSD